MSRIGKKPVTAAQGRHPPAPGPHGGREGPQG